MGIKKAMKKMVIKMNNPEAYEQVRKKVGERSIKIIEEIQKLIGVEPKTDLDIQKIEVLQKELDKTTSVFGKMTYPFWNLNKPE
jgi:folylpolyglutamate synthase/dihydropteroate synthase